MPDDSASPKLSPSSAAHEISNNDNKCNINYSSSSTSPAAIDQEVISIPDEDYEVAANEGSTVEEEPSHPILQSPLVGSYIKEIFTPRKDDDISRQDDVHATTSKILFLVTSKAPLSNDLSYVTIPLGEVESLASEIVDDRQKAIMEAVTGSIEEIEATHKTLVDDALANQESGFQEKLKIDEKQLEQVKKQFQESLTQRDNYWKKEMEKFKTEHERVISQLRENFEDSVKDTREEIKEMKERHKRSLDGYRIASCEALRLLKKRAFEE